MNKEIMSRVDEMKKEAFMLGYEHYKEQTEISAKAFLYAVLIVGVAMIGVWFLLVYIRGLL